MEAYDVASESRVLAGKGMLKRIKEQGFVPGVLYSSGDSVPISLEEHTLKGILNKFGNNVLLKVIHNGKTIIAKVKEVQRDPVSQDIMHIDLMPVEDEIDIERQIH